MLNGVDIDLVSCVNIRYDQANTRRRSDGPPILVSKAAHSRTLRLLLDTQPTFKGNSGQYKLSNSSRNSSRSRSRKDAETGSKDELTQISCHSQPTCAVLEVVEKEAEAFFHTVGFLDTLGTL